MIEYILFFLFLFFKSTIRELRGQTIHEALFVTAPIVYYYYLFLKANEQSYGDLFIAGALLFSILRWMVFFTYQCTVLFSLLFAKNLCVCVSVSTLISVFQNIPQLLSEFLKQKIIIFLYTLVTTIDSVSIKICFTSTLFLNYQ